MTASFSDNAASSAIARAAAARSLLGIVCALLAIGCQPAASSTAPERRPSATDPVAGLTLSLAAVPSHPGGLVASVTLFAAGGERPLLQVDHAVDPLASALTTLFVSPGTYRLEVVLSDAEGGVRGRAEAGPVHARGGADESLRLVVHQVDASRRSARGSGRFQVVSAAPSPAAVRPAGLSATSSLTRSGDGRWRRVAVAVLQPEDPAAPAWWLRSDTPAGLLDASADLEQLPFACPAPSLVASGARLLLACRHGDHWLIHQRHDGGAWAPHSRAAVSPHAASFDGRLLADEVAGCGLAAGASLRLICAAWERDRYGARQARLVLSRLETDGAWQPLPGYLGADAPLARRPMAGLAVDPMLPGDARVRAVHVAGQPDGYRLWIAADAAPAAGAVLAAATDVSAAGLTNLRWVAPGSVVDGFGTFREFARGLAVFPQETRDVLLLLDHDRRLLLAEELPR